MLQVFVSYSRKDSDFARRLVTALETQGIQTWIDREGIHAGSKWSETIQSALDESAAMVIIISPESMDSKNVRDEWQYFLDHDKPIIPILLRPSKIHFQLNRIQYVDFHSQHFDTAFHQLGTELYRHSVLNEELATVKSISSKPMVSNWVLGLGGGLIVLFLSVFGLMLIKDDNVSVSPLTDTVVPETFTELDSPGPFSEFASATDTELTESVLVRVITPFANLRGGPGMNYAEIATAVEGDEFNAVAQSQGFTTEGESIVWYYISHPVGGMLWISSEVVEIRLPDDTVGSLTLPTPPQVHGNISRPPSR